MSEALTVLAVDDEAPALDELTYLLQKHRSIGQVRTAADATLALRELHDGGIDAVFLDINMPGLSGFNARPTAFTNARRPSSHTTRTAVPGEKPPSCVTALRMGEPSSRSTASWTCRGTSAHAMRGLAASGVVDIGP